MLSPVHMAYILDIYAQALTNMVNFCFIDGISILFKFIHYMDWKEKGKKDLRSPILLIFKEDN